jgi:hypothetical protein
MGMAFGFANPSVIAVNYVTIRALVLDVDNDNNQDLLLLADSGPNGGVLVVRGKGDGTFFAGSFFASGSGAQEFASGDFNGDGKPDLAITNYSTADIGVLMGNGDGTFQVPTSEKASTALNTYPLLIGVGDFTGDGKLDIMTSVRATNGNQPDLINLLAGNGDGTFQPAMNLLTIFNPISKMLVGDFNNDRHSDLVLAWALTVYLGDGMGGLRQAGSSAPGTQPVGLLTADINGDGNLDFVVGDFVDHTLTPLLGKGDGSVQPNGSFSTNLNPFFLASADFNLDGKVDVAVVSNQGTAIMAFGDGSGNFSGSTPFNPGPGAASGGFCVTGDFNKDGKPDLVVVNGSGANLLLNNTQ